MNKSEKLKFLLASIINLMIFGLTIYVLVSLIKSALNGNNRFMYFTNISNITVGIIALINSVFLTLSILQNKNRVPKAFSIIKFVAISMTALTFIVVLCLIGPIDGYEKNYSGRNLFTHLIIPVLAFVSYICFEEKIEFEWKYSLFALIPLVIYSIIYVINVVGLNTWDDLYQINKQGLWYLFLLAFLIGDFAIGQGIYFLKKLIDRKSRP